MMGLLMRSTPGMPGSHVDFPVERISLCSKGLERCWVPAWEGLLQAERILIWQTRYEIKVS